jgi:catechol 2,3-dioxygenase-like lactoylglutathione lyase family enzyme
MDTSLHHVAVATADLDRSTAFYSETLGLKKLPRPAFSSQGAWYAAGNLKVHIILTPHGTFRATRTIDTGDVHFALRAADFAAAITELKSKGYSEDLPPGDPKALVIVRNSPAGFDQAYLLDPDNNIVEINAAS